MEIPVYWLTAVVLVAMCLTSHAMNIPQMDDLKQNQDDGKELNERASWLPTRDLALPTHDLEDNFVNLVELSLHQLASEGRVNPMVLPDDDGQEDNSTKQKRGRFQGFCFRKTNTGRFLPYVCWKQDKRK